MSNSSKLLAAALLAVLSAAAGAGMMEDTVATVNGTPIMLSAYQRELATSMDMWSHTEPEALRDPANVKKLRESTLDELINRELLYQTGVKEGLKARPREIEAGIDEIKQRFSKDDNGNDLTEAQTEDAFQRQLKADGMSEDEFRDQVSKQIIEKKVIEQDVRAKVVPPDEGDVKAYFNKAVAYMNSGSSEPPKGMDDEAAQALMQLAAQIKDQTSERSRVSGILIKMSPNPSFNERRRAFKTAQDIEKQLDADPSRFADVARDQSEDPASAARGGDMGYVVKGAAPPDIDKAVFSLPLGAISAPILTPIGYEVIRVEEKRVAEAPEFDKLKDDVSKFMMNVQFQKDLESYVKKLRDQAVIERSLPSASASASAPAPANP